MPRPVKRKKTSFEPLRRQKNVRLSEDVARRIGDGHPWVYRDALRGRALTAGDLSGVDLTDGNGDVLARGLYESEGNIAIRVFSRNPRAVFDRAHLLAAVGRAARWRFRLVADALFGPLGCGRALCGDSEGVPAINVDRYGDYLVVIAQSSLLEAFEAELFDVLHEVWRPRGIYLQRRYLRGDAGKARPAAELVRGDAAPGELVVAEGRARFVVDVTAPLGTGLFADMRLGRECVSRLAAGRRVLNCFSYTGAFSLVAALGGACQVTSVDAASRAHGRARRNFSENGLDADSRAYDFLVGDTVATLTRLAERKRRFDLVVVDPPTFSAGAKSRPFTTLRDYSGLIAAAVGVLEPGGVLVATSNTARLDRAEFERAIARGVAQAGRGAVVSGRIAQPADYAVTPGFAEGDFLKGAILIVD